MVPINFDDEELKIKKNPENYAHQLLVNDFTNKLIKPSKTYVNSIDNVNIQYKSEYTLIFDNMQCTASAALNAKMLLNNANIKIYLPFILCCENISANSKGSTMQTISFIDNIKGSHHQLTTKFNEFDVEILPIDFFKFNSDKFKEEYIEESAKIGFDHINNLLIPFKNIKYDKNNKSNDDLF